MLQTVRITSKRQITIPSKFFEKLNLKRGDRLIFELQDNGLRLKKAQQLVSELAGSVILPTKYRSLSPDLMVKKARLLHHKSDK